MAKENFSKYVTPSLIDKVSEFIENHTDLPDTYQEAIVRSINNLLVEYFKQNPFTIKQFNEDGEEQQVVDKSNEVIEKIRDSVKWMNLLTEIFTKTYLFVKKLDNIPTKGDYLTAKSIAEKYSAYQKSLIPAKINELRNALSIILYNTEIKDIPSNVTRIIYAIQRVQLGHPNPSIGVTALFFYSVSQGNGKSTCQELLKSAAKKVGINASYVDVEKLSNASFGDLKNPLDRIHIMCQPSFLKESNRGFNRKVLEDLIDGNELKIDIKFRNCVTQRFNGLICIGGNAVPKIGDRRYSVVHLIEDKLSKFANKPSKQDIENAWVYLLTHVVDEKLFKHLVPWEVLNNQKGVQNATTKAELYNVLIKMCDSCESDTEELTIQVQSVLAKFKNTIAPNLRSAYKDEINSLVEQGIIKCNTQKVTNISKLSFSKNDLAKLDFGDEIKTYDYQNHTTLIRQAIEDYLPDSLENQNIEDNYKTGDFLEWGLYGYAQNGEYQVLNNLKTPYVPEGYVSPRVQCNCYMDRFLYESDNMTLKEQKTVLERLIQQNAVYRATYSGSKSIHMIVEIDHECSDIKEYKFFWHEIAKELGLNLDSLDEKCSENSRLTRRPGVMRVLEKEKFDKYSKDATELFGAKIEPDAHKIEQKLLYDGYNVYNCYFRIKDKYLESKFSQETVTSKKIYTFNGKQSNITTFVINYAKKNNVELDFSEGNGHDLGCRLIGACLNAGFSLHEIEDWLRENCNRFDELRKGWKGLL